jgi:hypothetical protein
MLPDKAIGNIPPEPGHDVNRAMDNVIKQIPVFAISHDGVDRQTNSVFGISCQGRKAERPHLFIRRQCKDPPQKINSSPTDPSKS